MSDDARILVVIGLWWVTLALAFAAGWVWRNGRLAREPRGRGSSVGRASAPTVLRVPDVGEIRHVSGPPEGVLLIPDDPPTPWRPKRQSTTIPVRGSEWYTAADVERLEPGRARVRAARAAERDRAPDLDRARGWPGRATDARCRACIDGMHDACQDPRRCPCGCSR